MLVYCAGQM